MVYRLGQVTERTDGAGPVGASDDCRPSNPSGG